VYLEDSFADGARSERLNGLFVLVQPENFDTNLLEIQVTAKTKSEKNHRVFSASATSFREFPLFSPWLAGRPPANFRNHLSAN